MDLDSASSITKDRSAAEVLLSDVEPVHAPSSLSVSSSHSVTEKSVSSAFGKLRHWENPQREPGMFDQLGANDELAMEGPVMEDFGDYMALKMAKIKRQYKASEEVGSQDLKASKTLFTGLTAFISTSIYVEHSTHLSTQRQDHAIDFKYLSRIWLAHGGTLTQNITNGQLTHFVNSFLPIYFLRDIEKVKSKIRCVSPQWILDCVEQNRRLSTFPYHLQVVDAEGVSTNDQQHISFATLNSGSTAREPMETGSKPTEERTNFLLPTDPAAQEDVISAQNGEEDDENPLEQHDEWDNQTSAHRMMTSAENPNFVADYFASSRLHHLSSWKMKFQEELELHLMSLANKKDASTEPSKSKQPRHSRSSIHSQSQTNGDQEEIPFEPMYVHIDMDAFFASVATRHKLDLREKPVVISHGGNRALCASVNYAARRLGIKNGSRLGDVQQICTAAGEELVVLGYDFAEYELVSRLAHEIFLQYTSRIQIKSCDEAILDFSDQNLNFSEISHKVEEIRRRVFEATSCTCSAGIGSSVVLARFALSKAKPNGLFVAPTWSALLEKSATSEGRALASRLMSLLASARDGSVLLDSYHRQAIDLLSSDVATRILKDECETLSPMSFLKSFPLGELPGVGWRTKPKFGDLKTVGEVQHMTIQELRQLLGVKIGANIFLAARGLDAKLARFDKPSERKSISVDLSYGVRFNSDAQVSKFICDVAQELAVRCKKTALMGKTVTVKLWVRHPDAKPTTFLGHGYCNTVSKSNTFSTHTSESKTIAEAAERLVFSFRIPPVELRGFGLSLTHLASSATVSSIQSHSITSMFKSALQKGNKKIPDEGNAQSDAPISAPLSAKVAEEPNVVQNNITCEGEDKEDNKKKRLRTIDNLLEKKLHKKTKKAEIPKSEANRAHKTRKLPEKSKMEDVKDDSSAPVFTSVPAATRATNVIAYVEVDTSLLLELESWMKNRLAPVAVHGELIFQFAQTLLQARNFEDLHLLAKRLKRIASENDAWSAFTGPTIEAIQQGVQQELGCFLSL